MEDNGKDTRSVWQRYRTLTVITGVFLLFIAFLAPGGTIVEAVSLRRSIRRMQRERMEYRERAQEDSAFLQSLRGDSFLEKYAREHFYMKGRGEEIYLVK